MSARLLLVDNEQLVLNGLERMLGDEYDIHTNCSALAALDSLRDGERYDLMVVDQQMPEMQGIDFIVAAREIVSGTRYIMLTGNQDAETRDMAERIAKVDGFLNKPCSRIELVEAIDVALSK